MQKTVYFRTFEEEDVDLIYKWMNDDELKELSIGLNRRMCKEEVIDWINKRKSHNQYQFFWAICSIKTNTMVGYASLNDVHYINRTAYMGGMIIGDRGPASSMALFETMLFQLDFAFNQLNMHKVYESYLADHETSRLIANAFMYQLEGIARDSIYKNGKYHDEIYASLLQCEYQDYVNKGLFEIRKIQKRVIEAKAHNKLAYKDIELR